MLNKILFIFTITLVLFLNACGEPDPKSITDSGSWEDREVTLDEIDLFWEESYFVHDSLKVTIPDDWSGFGKKSDFDELNKHDLEFQYRVKTITYYDESTKVVAELKDIDHEPPSESTRNFIIDMTNVDISSKLLIQDEYVNDYYLKFDFENDSNNHCYLRIDKNDANQLIDGSFNELRFDLRVLTHADGTISFKIKTEDGITQVGYYDNVGIYYNPDLVN